VKSNSLPLYQNGIGTLIDTSGTVRDIKCIIRSRLKSVEKLVIEKPGRPPPRRRPQPAALLVVVLPMLANTVTEIVSHKIKVNKPILVQMLL
jgi:hypothetical protein